MGKVITEVFAFVLIDDDGDEAVPAFGIPGQIALPMMGADLTRVAELRALAERDPKLRGHRLTVLRFSHRETLYVIDRTESP